MPSRSRSRAVLVLIAVATATLGAAGPAAAQTIGGQVVNANLLDGRLVYAALSANDGSWSLQQRFAEGTTAPLPIAPFTRAPDADWGTLRDGKPMLVYSRDDDRGDSRIFVYDPVTQVEAAVSGTGDRAREELQPTLWNGTLGFWRRARSAASGGEYRLFSLGTDRPSRTVKRVRFAQSVLGADLNGRGLALSLLREGAERREVSVQVKHYNQGFRTVTTASSGQLSAVHIGEPSWRGNHVLWAFARRLDAPRRQIGRAYITQRRTEIAKAMPTRPADAHRDILGIAADNLDPASPIWINTFTPEEEDGSRQPGSSLYPRSVKSLSFR